MVTCVLVSGILFLTTKNMAVPITTETQLYLDQRREVFTYVKSSPNSWESKLVIEIKLDDLSKSKFPIHSVGAILKNCKRVAHRDDQLQN